MNAPVNISQLMTPPEAPSGKTKPETTSSDDFKATLANEMLLSAYRLENEYVYQHIAQEMLDLAERLEDAAT